MATGIDIVEIEDLKVLINRFGQRVINKLFTPGEIIYCTGKPNQFQHFAARMAAKEATFKALGHGWNKGIQWKNVEVVNDDSGAPCLVLSGKAELFFNQSGYLKHKISISHSKSYAISVVIFYN